MKQHKQSTYKISPRNIAAFQRMVRKRYQSEGRSLPWRPPSLPLRRGVADSYPVLVSEVMLQQTQVDRVVQKYNEFLGFFPTIEVLSLAPLSDILRAWQGLGYNRRARALKCTADIVCSEKSGQLPRDEAELVRLPGIGTYTARAVRAFAWNEPVILLETNIRTVFIHHFFADRDLVRDRHIEPLIAATLDQKNPREWYFALMDYGAYLKKTMINPGRKSAHYTRQNRFEGSGRQLRGQILKLTINGGTITQAQIKKQSGRKDSEIQEKILELIQEGFLERRGRGYVIRQ